MNFGNISTFRNFTITTFTFNLIEDDVSCTVKGLRKIKDKKKEKKVKNKKEDNKVKNLMEDHVACPVEACMLLSV